MVFLRSMCCFPVSLGSVGYRCHNKLSASSLPSLGTPWTVWVSQSTRQPHTLTVNGIKTIYFQPWQTARMTSGIVWHRCLSVKYNSAEPECRVWNPAVFNLNISYGLPPPADFWWMPVPRSAVTCERKLQNVMFALKTAATYMYVPPTKREPNNNDTIVLYRYRCLWATEEYKNKISIQCNRK